MLVLDRFFVVLVLGCLESALFSPTGPAGDDMAPIWGLGLVEADPGRAEVDAGVCLGANEGVCSFDVVDCSGREAGSGREMSSMTSSVASSMTTLPLRENGVCEGS